MIKARKTTLDEIIKLYKGVNGIYGYRRIKLNLDRILNKTINLKRVYRIMKELNLQSVIRKKKKKYIKSSAQITAENILNRNFESDEPNKKWLTDVTEFKLVNGRKVYLSAILDLYDNSIVSYNISTSNNNQLVFDTFDLAVIKNPTAKPLFHSDRGFQYTHRKFRMKLEDQGCIQSMSRVARCIDNGPMEGFWGIIKSEMYYLDKFYTLDELSSSIDTYIKFYNENRLQKRLDSLSPLEYRSEKIIA